MKNLNKLLILAGILTTLAAVGCSSAPKNEESTQPAVSQSQPSSPVDLGASSAGRGR